MADGSVSRAASGEIRALLVSALSCAALAARPVAWVAVFLTATVGAAAFATPLPAFPRAPSVASLSVLSRVAAATLVGLAAVAAARAVAGPAVGSSPATGAGVVAVLVAAVAEEALFRRLLYGALERWGPVVAVLGSALTFAAVHLPAYPPGAVAVDLAVGLLFGWQRWAAGTWAVPAVTHALANLAALV
jgi:membrane protease YdiL (CAAX protease family)